MAARDNLSKHQFPPDLEAKRDPDAQRLGEGLRASGQYRPNSAYDAEVPKK